MEDCKIDNTWAWVHGMSGNSMKGLVIGTYGWHGRIFGLDCLIPHHLAHGAYGLWSIVLGIFNKIGCHVLCRTQGSIEKYRYYIMMIIITISQR